MSARVSRDRLITGVRIKCWEIIYLTVKYFDILQSDDRGYDHTAGHVDYTLRISFY